jgi:hypothetical protein
MVAVDATRIWSNRPGQDGMNSFGRSSRRFLSGYFPVVALRREGTTGIRNVKDAVGRMLMTLALNGCIW